MKRGLLISVLSLFLILSASTAEAAKTEWRSIGKGLGYASIRVGPGTIHALRVDPKLNRFGIVTARQLNSTGSSVEAMAKKGRAAIAINGGFFTPEYESLGLLISDKERINPLRKTGWWSVFFISGDSPGIVHTNSFQADPSISMAIQSGPRLVVDGSIPRLKPSLAERSAICITEGKDVVLIATEGLLIQPHDLAGHLRRGESEGGLGCRSALNLDGGSSTQIYARVGSFKLDVPGAKYVANAVVVYPKR